MDAENRRSDAVTHLIGRLRDRSADIARDVAADLGAGVTAAAAEPVVERFLAAIVAGGVRVGEADLVRLRAEGAAAAREGQPLASPIDAYLSTAWVAWEHALGVAADGDAAVLGALGAALLACRGRYRRRARRRLHRRRAGARVVGRRDPPGDPGRAPRPGIGGRGRYRPSRAPGRAGRLRPWIHLPAPGHPPRDGPRRQR